MSDKDYEELKRLKKECDEWRKSYKIINFKRLPSHIRQLILDEAIIKNMERSQDFDPVVQKFPHYNRMKELINICKTDYRYYLDEDYVFSYRYCPFTNHLTLDELSSAHSQAELEERILN